jgi:hypothetical protein
LVCYGGGGGGVSQMVLFNAVTRGGINARYQNKQPPRIEKKDLRGLKL